MVAREMKGSLFPPLESSIGSLIPPKMNSSINMHCMHYAACCMPLPDDRLSPFFMNIQHQNRILSIPYSCDMICCSVCSSSIVVVVVYLCTCVRVCVRVYATAFTQLVSIIKE